MDTPFDIPERQQWLELAVAGIASDTTQQAALDTLRRTTLDGIAIEVLYDSAEHTLNASALPRHFASWDNRCSVNTRDPENACQQVMRALEGGATSIELYVSDPSSIKPSLHSVQLAMAGISLRPTGQHKCCMEALQQLAESQGIEPAALRCSINADPVGGLLRSTACAEDIRAENDSAALADSLADSLAKMAGLAQVCADDLPSSTSVLVDVTIHHNAGASCVEELHAALATGVVYLEALLAHGLDAESACRQIVFQIAVDADLLMGVAKLRAVRALWQYTVQQVTGQTDMAATAVVIAETSRRHLSTMQPWNNHLRNLSASTAALLGGADTLIVHPHDVLQTVDTRASNGAAEVSDRMARNIAVILERECGLCKVADPMAGSYAIENLTQQLMQYTWQSLASTDTAAGWLDELFTGRWKSRLAQTHQRRMDLLQNEQQIVVGVNRYIHNDAAKNAATKSAAAIETSTQAPSISIALTPVRDAEFFEQQARTESGK